MSLKDICFKALEILDKPVSRAEVTDYIINNNLFDFSKTKKPTASVSSELGKLSNNDSRVGRYKDDGVYLYYLLKNEQTIKFDIESKKIKQSTQNHTKKFYERDLHILLSTFLSSKKIYTKTIFHEQNNQNDKNQI